MTSAKMTKVHSSRGSALMPGEDRRRSQRVVIGLPVKLLTLENGQQRVMAARTVEVNDHGAMVACARPFEPNAKLEVLNERTGEKVACRVTRSPREAPEGFLVPVEFTAPAPNFWQITFPPDNWKAPEN